jgi:anthranilate phosphoribosyltransferase
MREAIARLTARQPLREAEMQQVITTVMGGGATPAQIGAFLVALRMKGETVDEITGAVRALREHAVSIRPAASVIVDTCGTGGDGRGTFNVSTAAALIAAAAGVSVAKHGNRAMSGKVGGADVLEALGVRIDVPAETVATCIDRIGIGFLFAQSFHPAMRHVAAPRRELGVRTIFNLLGPLANPAGARRQVLGVFSPDWLRPLAETLCRLGSDRALVVHGRDGMDEISLCAPTAVIELRGSELKDHEWTPEDFGLQRCDGAELVVQGTEDAVRAIQEVLDGETGPRLDIALLNAAAAIYVGGRATSIAQGLEAAREAVGSGAAREKLNRLVELTNR